MSSLFTSKNIGSLEIKTRFIHSATYEGLAKENGEVTDELIRRYTTLAKGRIGLIITGYMYVHPLGKAHKYATGIYSDQLIPGLQKLTRAVHNENGKIFFQLNHAGRQTTKTEIGETPVSPSSHGRDPVNFVKPREMNEDQIMEAINSYTDAAKRAADAGADGVQLHAAHGYLINQFISPFFNHRKDSWGGTDEKRFRFLKEIVLSTKK